MRGFIMNNEIKIIVVDVDGTMTDGGVYYDENGNELKKFCTKDAAGFFAARAAGIRTMVLTGRRCRATQRRMEELKADYIYQGIKDKKTFLADFMEKNNLQMNNVGYIADDLNDLSAMKLAGFIGCPADSCNEVKALAHYVSTVNGGAGAVRDIIEYLLKEMNQWDYLVDTLYGGI
ncbi:MAG: hypothetical protein HDR28_00085 [Lachnospiraceae bacterium]|nr:hypothetical protein [Lachnospiraceae bacterium]